VAVSTMDKIYSTAASRAVAFTLVVTDREV
jgi:hypothetical protein